MKVIREKDTPKGVLETALGDSDSIDAALILVIRKDGTHSLICSHTHFSTKASLVAFAQYWLNQWFAAGEHRT